MYTYIYYINDIYIYIWYNRCGCEKIGKTSALRVWRTHTLCFTYCVWLFRRFGWGGENHAFEGWSTQNIVNTLLLTGEVVCCLKLKLRGMRVFLFTLSLSLRISMTLYIWNGFINKIIGNLKCGLNSSDNHVVTRDDKSIWVYLGGGTWIFPVVFKHVQTNVWRLGMASLHLTYRETEGSMTEFKMIVLYLYCELPSGKLT